MKGSLYLRFLSLALCLVMLVTTLTGCGFLFGGDDVSEDVFDPPYLENYYVNKHEPVCKEGKIEIHKYENADDILWMGGHAYHGGLELVPLQTGDENAWVDLPLEGLYDSISFVIGGDCGEITRTVDENGNESYPYESSQFAGSPPTLIGQAKEIKVGIQFLVDEKVVEEVLFSNYQVPVRYTYNVSGAQKFSIKTVAGARDLAGSGTIPIMELTVWDGEAHETGHVTAPAGSDPVQLIKDLKPYLIPSTSGAVYYPNISASSEGRNYIDMSGVRYENVIATYVSMGMVTDDEEDIYFNLEGKYNYLSFVAGAADRTTTHNEGSAWLTVYADGKILYEEKYSTHELPRKVELEVTGCKQLKFGWLTDEGNENFGNAVGSFYGIADAYVATTDEALDGTGGTSGEFPDRPVKMISELGVFGVLSNMQDDAVLDGSTQFKTFSMGGVKYNEGVMLHASNNVLSAKPAYAAFNLGGKYNTISFVTGHVSNSNIYENEQLEIYADGVLVSTIDVKCTTLPSEHTVDVTGCKHLEFVSGKLTNQLMERPVVGIANLVAYPDGYVETELFPERKPEDFGKTCDLIDAFGFYDVYNSHISKLIGAVGVEDGYYDGTTQKNYFELNGKRMYKGVLLKTNVHLELDMAGLAGAVTLGSMFGGWGWSILAFATAGEAHESAFALANIKDSGYTSVTFTVAMQQDNSSILVADESTLMIGADDECVKEITVSKDMAPTTYTVELGEACERLMFWLNCGADDDASHTYAIYDITLNKGDSVMPE